MVEAVNFLFFFLVAVYRWYNKQKSKSRQLIAYVIMIF